jgi:diguanylate cyclase (GGDEF)-like protein
MGIKVVAEGIETDQELNYCREIGCDYLQGFRISHPQQDILKLSPSYDLKNNCSSFGKRRGENQSSLIEERLTYITPVQLSDDGDTILKRFQKDHSIWLLPVVNELNAPLGVIREKDLKQYVYSPYGISLFQHHSNNQGLESLIARIPMADVNSSIEEILDITAVCNQSEGIMITHNGKYLGLLEPSNLIQLIYEQKLAYARDQNPLSGLPGNFTVHKMLAEVLENPVPQKRIIFFDFNNFKPFNDTYGFRMGDRLIILFGEILKKTYNLNKDFIGHVGGDDFLVIQSNPHEDEVYRLTKKAQADFAESALSYYVEDHRNKGCITARNRKGQFECFSLISVSAAVVEVVVPGTTTLDELNKILFDLKKQSKCRKDNFALVELNQNISDMAAKR